MEISSSTSSGIETDVEEYERPRRRRRRRSHLNIIRLMHEYSGIDAIFEHLFGLSRMDFERLQNMIGRDINRKHTQFRHMNPIRPRDRIGISLRFLTTGSSFETLGQNYNLQPAIVETIVLEVCNSILQYLKPLVMPQPTKEMWKSIAAGFKKTNHMPNCIGCLNGRVVNIMQDEKKTLLMLIDSNQKFILMDIGDYGPQSSGAWDRTAIGKRFSSKELDLPNDRNPDLTPEVPPYVIVGGNHFLIKPDLLLKYKDLEYEDYDAKKVHNSYVDPIKRTGEEAVSRLRHKWRLIQSNYPVPLSTARNITMTACCLENYFGTPE